MAVTPPHVRASDSQIVLVVDDMSANIAMIMNMLPESYEVSPAKSGEDALEVLAHSYVDVALLDIEMPGMTGIELFEKMLAHPDYKTIPVIFVTSDKESAVVQKAIRMGAKGYVVKPFNANTLVSTMRKVLSAATEDQATRFLRSKIQIVIDACTKSGNFAEAESVMKEFPRTLYSKFISLKLNRMISALHNKAVDEVIQLTDGLIEEDDEV